MATKSVLTRRVPLKLLAIALGACLPAACSSTGKPPAEAQRAAWPVFASPRMESVVIDGDAADWGDGGFRVDALITDRGSMPGQGPMPARQDCSAGMRLGWNDTGLFVLLVVTGSDWSEAQKSYELYAGDSVEFYLAPRPGGLASP